MNVFKRKVLLLTALLPLAAYVPANATDFNVWPESLQLRKVHFEPDTIRFGQPFSLQMRDPDIGNCDVVYAWNLYFEDIDGHFEINVYHDLGAYQSPPKKLIPGCTAAPGPFGPVFTGVTAKKDRYDGIVRWNGNDTTWPGNYTTFGTILNKTAEGNVVAESFRQDMTLKSGGKYPVYYHNMDPEWVTTKCATCGYSIFADSITILPALSNTQSTGINSIAQTAISHPGMAAAYAGGHLSLRMPSGGSWSGDLMTAAGKRVAGIHFAGERFELQRNLGTGVYVIALRGKEGMLRGRVVATEK